MSLSNPLGTFRNFRTPGGMISRQARISQTFRPNSLCFAREGSEHAEIPLSTAPNPALIVLGCYQGLATYTSGSTDDGTGGATNADGTPAMVQLRPGIADGFTTGTGANQIQAKHVDLPCFAFDDNTLYLTDLGGTLPFAGFVDAVASGSFPVSVRMGEDQRVLFQLFSAAGLYPGAAAVTQDDTARAVVTNLPAGTFAAGVFTVTATGALPSQDGVTLVAGQKVVMPPGTLTTQAVTAAQSGPYEVVNPGGTGIQAVLARTAKFAHGATITPNTTVKVGGEGTNYKNTVWVSKPATLTKVVDTDDPLMFPSEMIIPLTCASGTATTALCPLRAAGLFWIGCDFTGGSPAAGTTSIQASTQTPGGIGTASIVIQEQDHLGHLVATGTATATVIVRQ